MEVVSSCVHIRALHVQDTRWTVEHVCHKENHPLAALDDDHGRQHRIGRHMPVRSHGVRKQVGHMDHALPGRGLDDHTGQTLRNNLK